MPRSGGGGRAHRPTHSPARLAALNAALLTQKRGMSMDDALESVLAGPEIHERDRRLAEEIGYGCIRHRGSIDTVLAAVSSIPPEKMQPAVLEALRGAVYQAFFLTRIPEHAAVDEAVRLARRFGEARAAGFANAVLRAALALRAGRRRGALSGNARRCAFYFRGGEYVMSSRPLLPDPDADRAGWLAGHYSCPRWLVGELLHDLGAANAERVLRWGNELPQLCVRVNPLRTAVAELAGREPSELCAGGAVFAGCAQAWPCATPECWRLEPQRPVGQLPGLRAGLFTVQDAAQQRAAPMLAPRPGERILDLCAAPGGKSTHLAELAGDGCAILACDAEAPRLELVGQAAARLGLSSIRTRQMRVPPLADDLAGRFDAVLADVPCSNTGAMNRRVEARWRVRPETVAELAVQQARILDCALQAARPGGRVLYATCSLLSAENSGVVRRALDGRTGTRLVREELLLPAAGRNDGAYLALLEV